MTARPRWRDLLGPNGPLLLPIAHDALSARLIERAGFKAYSVGGFALVGARFGLPDIGLVGLAEMAQGVRDIMAASDLPILVDGDDGYGDVKNVSRTIGTYEQMGVSAVFIEDQVAPKRCGHMAGKDVIPSELMEAKIRAAAAAREGSDLFLIARTDARAVHGLDEALRRGERYLKAGADGLFIEAPQSVEELRIVGERFKGVRLNIEPGVLRIASSNAEQEEAKEELEIDYNGDAIEIGFNVTYLIDALANTSVEMVKLELQDTSSSALFTLPEQPGFKYVVMPMRI